MPRRGQGPGPDRHRLYRIATEQAGYVTARQAGEAGYSSALLSYYVDVGRLERVARGILRVPEYPAADHEDLVVVWLWSGRHGVFSHETALVLHELSDALPARIHVTLPPAWARRRLRVPGVVAAHYADVGPESRGWSGPVPVTSVERTIRDCALAGTAPDLLRQAARQAVRRGLCTSQELTPVRRAAAARRRRRP